MPLRNYVLVVGKPIDWVLDDDSNPHIEVLLDVNGDKHRAAVNVRSQVAPHTLMFKRIHPFEHRLIERLEQLASGTYDLKTDHPDLALDYVRDDVITPGEMEELPYRSEGPKNDLLDHLTPVVENAIASQDALFYFFGEAWGPEPGKPDAYFHFLPGRGIHDIHMNQGSSGRFIGTNGVRQDGALIIRHGDDQWSAIFLAFTSQSWDTDANGNPKDGSVDTPTSPLRVVAALINPINPEEGRETVSLINLSDKALNLDGWHLEDGEGRNESLSGYDIGAGDTVRVRLSGTSMRLKNKDNGEIRLIEPGGAIVQKVVYRKEDTRNEGWSALFLTGN